MIALLAEQILGCHKHDQVTLTAKTVRYPLGK